MGCHSSKTTLVLEEPPKSEAGTLEGEEANVEACTEAAVGRKPRAELSPRLILDGAADSLHPGKRQAEGEDTDGLP